MEETLTLKDNRLKDLFIYLFIFLYLKDLFVIKIIERFSYDQSLFEIFITIYPKYNYIDTASVLQVIKLLIII